MVLGDPGKRIVPLQRDCKPQVKIHCSRLYLFKSGFLTEPEAHVFQLGSLFSTHSNPLVFAPLQVLGLHVWRRPCLTSCACWDPSWAPHGFWAKILNHRVISPDPLPQFWYSLFPLKLRSRLGPHWNGYERWRKPKRNLISQDTHAHEGLTAFSIRGLESLSLSCALTGICTISHRSMSLSVIPLGAELPCTSAETEHHVTEPS